MASPSFQPSGIATGLATEFNEIASRGNVVDLAVDVIIGTAFGCIVDSLVRIYCR